MPIDFYNLELLFTNIGLTISIALTYGMGLFSFLKGPKKILNNTFLLMTVCIGTFFLSHLIGINISDPEQSRFVFLFDVVALFAFVSSVHLVLVVTDTVKKRAWVLWLLYGLAFVLVGVVIAAPDLYMKSSAPFLYFPNYYVPGILYPIQTLIETLILVYLVYCFYTGYKKTDRAGKNRLWYFILAYIYAYGVSVLPIFPLYRIPIDPILSIFFGLWVIPITYGILKEDLMDIRIIARNAFVYLALVIGSTVALVAINIGNVLLIQNFQAFPIWIVPAISSLIGVGFAIFVWSKAKESDLLKYEFVNIVTHKFRTPMTHIKLSLDELRSLKCDETAPDAIERIELANNNLVELTDVLMETAEASETQYYYHFSSENLNEFISKIMNAHQMEIASQKILVQKNFAADIPPVSIDRDRMGSVFQILIENAIKYSKQGSTVSITTKKVGSYVECAIADQGIGITPGDLPRIFTEFFRTVKATSIDTEGMGVGLFITKRIVERHGGKIWVKSQGENKGSTFFVSLPTQ